MNAPRHLSHALAEELKRLQTVNRPHPVRAVGLRRDLSKRIRLDSLWRAGANGEQLQLDMEGDA